jgi:hypothetical protein
MRLIYKIWTTQILTMGRAWDIDDQEGIHLL